MTTSASDLALSGDDRNRVERVEALARAGAQSVGELLGLLDDPSWAVRRTVVTALARLGAPTVEPLIDVLMHHRENENRLAAAVDALSASTAAVDHPLMQLAGGAHQAPVLCDAVQVLGRRRCRNAVQLLATLAKHDDDNVAVAAIEALGRIGGVDTLEPLVAAVEAKNFFRTFPAIDALGRTGDARAVRPLAALLDDTLYMGEALRALGHTGQEAAVQPLARHLLKPVDAVVRTAAAALSTLRERHEARFGETESMARALTEAVVPSQATQRVMAVMTTAAPSEAQALTRILGWLGDEVAIAQLVELAAIEAPATAGAADALRRLGPRAAPQLMAAIGVGDSARRGRLLRHVTAVGGSAAELVACLEDPDPGVRILACDALARAGETGAVTSLFRLIGDRDTAVSQAAAAAIQSLGSIETRRLALEQARSDDPRTRRAALRIIAYFGYPEGLDVLVRAMDEEDEKIRESAIAGLALIEDPRAVETLLSTRKHESPRTRAAVARALGQTTRRDDVVDALRDTLEDEDAWVRYYACQSLGKLRADAAADAVVARIEDPAGQVRVAAVEALARLGSPAAGRALASAATSEDADMRRAALVGLGIARGTEFLPLLRAAATGGDAATRLVAVSAIAEFDSPEVVPALAQAASDPDESVRSAAIGFLSTRPGADATQALLQHLGSQAHEGVHERVLAALAVAPDERIDGILTALERASADRATLLVGALTRMRRASGHAAIAAALTFDNVEARRAAAAALAALGTPEAREALHRVVSSDPDIEVRRICAAMPRAT